MYTLYPHQTYAIDWMMEREMDKEAPGGLLCDEMGLGKTITTIHLLLKKKVSRTLILGPLAVLQQWTKAILNSGPAVYERTKHEWIYKGGNILQGRVYVCNYDKLLSEPSAFEMDWGRIICDEAHTIRNSSGERYKRLKALTTKYMWLLTGTPIVNSKKDIGSLVALFHTSVKSNNNPSLEEAHLWMKNYALCRTAAQLRSTLHSAFPKDPTILTHTLAFETEKEANFYYGIQGKLSADLQALMMDDSSNIMVILQLLLRLRQISLHPQVYINAKKRQTPSYTRPDWTDDSTKVNAIVNILTEEKESHGYVLFCHFHEEMDLLKERLAKVDCVGSIETYHGKLTSAERASVLQRAEHAVCTEKTKHTILLAQIQTAGTGLNLQFMDRVIFTSSWWTAALMDQAIARVVRIGQSSEVVIHHLTLEEEDETVINIDRFINKRVEIKRELCKTLLDSANHSVMDDFQDK